jgi:signal transduction histidine kinase
MATLDHLREWIMRSRRTYLVGVTLTLVVLGATVAVGWLLARTLIRDQISQRDADLLHATTIMQQEDARLASGGAMLKSDEQIGFDAAILASRIKGVMGIRFFDPEGRFTDSFPASIQPQDLDAHTLAFIRQGHPHSNYRSDTPMSDVFIYRPAFDTGRVDRIPLLDVTVPLHRPDDGEMYGSAQFLVEGYSIARQYAALDRHLAGLAGLTFLVAATLLGMVLWGVFRKVERLNAQLASQNRDLARANEELAMAARTSAVGAISSNLMHGLKNPLASLSRYVRDLAGENGRPNGSEDSRDLRDAVAATKRMQALVEHTTEVLAEARGGTAYEIGIDELAEDVSRRVTNLANARGVGMDIEVVEDLRLSSRIGNLVSLVLVNLMENALEASPSGSRVSLKISQQRRELVCCVRDQGPGFPEALRPRLFLPCKSTREGGSGIGLTISKKIADHLGAGLELEDNPDGGCTFTLRIPIEPDAGTRGGPLRTTGNCG